MATGSFWNVTNPAKPWGPFDPDAEIVFPIEVDAWLDELATTYASHEVIAENPLECLSPGAYAAGVISVRITLADEAVYEAGKLYPFTMRIVGADGQKDDRSLWLRIKDR